MKSFFKILGVTVLACAAGPAVAGLQLEGLKPFHTAYCDGADPSRTDPMVAPPADAWETTSPDANTLRGRPAWDAVGCLSGKYEGGSRVHKAKPAAKSPKPVPQK